jgi:hypothetical protein
MKKIIFTIIAISFFIFSVSTAQDKICKKGHCLKGDVGFISLSIGPSIPVGNFANKDIKNANAGFAKTGSKVGINAGFKLLENVNIGASLFYSVNSYDVSSLTQKLANDYPGTTWGTSGRSWDIYGGMVGLTYSYPFKNRFVSDFKFQSGFMQSSIPEMVVTSNNNLKITEAKKSASSLVYLISVGGHYPLGRLLDIVGNLEYLGSSPSFSNISRVYNLPTYNPPGIVTSSSTTSYNQNISMLSLNFGFRVKF